MVGKISMQSGPSPTMAQRPTLSPPTNPTIPEPRITLINIAEQRAQMYYLKV
ncbi:hypothetical protein ACMYSQ_005209 [Aspergillus niger]